MAKLAKKIDQQATDRCGLRSKFATPSLCITTLMMGLAMSACQPNQEQAEVQIEKPQLSSEVTPQKPVVMSEAVRQHIASYEVQFVQQMLNLQQSEIAEYEALQAADTPDSEADTVHHDSSQAATNKNTDTATDSVAADQSKTANKADDGKTSEETVVDSIDETITTWPLANIPIMEPQQLTDSEISSRYNVAMQSLYLPDNVSIPTQAVDTLLNIAMLTPEVFTNTEVAERLVIKMPSLARLIRQYQIWQQIEAQQNEELEQLKQTHIEAQQKQSAEFEKIIKEFNDKIEDYDQQIKKYEKALKKFE